MRLGRLTPAIVHKIWQPRWHDRTVLIAKHKVSTHNIIEFTKAPSLKGKFYYMLGADIAKYPVEPMHTKAGAKMSMYVVPLDDLEVYEGRTDD